MLTRRGLITCLISLVAAPAIVRAASLMPVKVMPDEAVLRNMLDMGRELGIIQELPVGVVPAREIYADLIRITREAFLPRYEVERLFETPLLSEIKRQALA